MGVGIVCMPYSNCHYYQGGSGGEDCVAVIAAAVAVAVAVAVVE